MRPRFLLPLILTIALAGSAVEPAAADSGSDELTMASLANTERAAGGLAPLATRGELFDSARAWSGSLATAGVLSHDNGYFTARAAGARILAENVAMAGSIEDAHRRLMASEGHRVNIMNPAFTDVGVGVVWTGAQVWITERFASYAPAGSSAPAQVKTPARTHRVRRGRRARR